MDKNQMIPGSCESHVCLAPNKLYPTENDYAEHSHKKEGRTSCATLLHYLSVNPRILDVEPVFNA